jgi:K+-transporting ATPase c subunit
MHEQLFIGGSMISYSNLISRSDRADNNEFNNKNTSKHNKEFNSTNTQLSNRTNNAVNRLYNDTLLAEHYITMDLCSQAHMSEDADNILSRMDKLRAFAKEQQIKRVKSQRQQISFCF